jgi:hypothetical protein
MTNAIFAEGRVKTPQCYRQCCRRLSPRPLSARESTHDRYASVYHSGPDDDNPCPPSAVARSTVGFNNLTVI